MNNNERGSRKILSAGIAIGAMLATMIIGDKLNISEELIKYTIGAVAGTEFLYIGGNLVSKKITGGGKNGPT